MVRKILERIASPIRGLHEAAYLLAGLTLASQLLALLRDRAFADTFGAGQTLDIYYAAFRVPDLVYALVASLVSAYVLIPRIANLDRQETKRLISESASFLLFVGGAACALLAVWMPEFLHFLYPDLAASPHQASFILLARLLLIQPILLGLSGIFSSVTQVHRRFFLFAIAPVLYNLGIIFGALVLYPRYGLTGIGAGVLAGAFLHLFVNTSAAIADGAAPKLAIPRLADILPIVRDSVPRSLALGMGSITALGLTALASRIGAGAVSVFTFASNLQAVPLALIGSSYAVAAFPALSEASALEKREEFTRILSSSARHIILWSLVAFGLVVVLRAHLVRVILGTGAFDWDDTRLTAALLAVLMVGLAAQCLVLLFSRALYAVRQSWRPFFYQLISGALTLLCALAFLALPETGFPTFLAEHLKADSVAGSAVLLIALASSLGQLFLLALSLLALKNVTPGLASSLVRPLVDGLVAAAAGGAAAYAVLALEGQLASLTTLAAVFTQGFLAGMVGCAASAFVLFLMGNEEFLVMAGAFGKLLRLGKQRSSVLAPSAEEPLRP